MNQKSPDDKTMGRTNENLDGLKNESILQNDTVLDSGQLNDLEQSFRTWSTDSKRKDIRLSRARILIYFLIIRKTGAKLNEVLKLNPYKHMDIEQKTIMFPNPQASNGMRLVPLANELCEEIRVMLSEPGLRDLFCDKVMIDPGFVRRKFYERAKACGFPQQLGGPEMIRKARAVELLKNDMPFHAVQTMLGHSGSGQISTYVEFSPEEVHQATRLYLEREASRKTSARNSFYCKIQDIVTGDIQACVYMMTIEGQALKTVVTIDSVHMLGLKKGSVVTAEVKAPWIDLYSGDSRPRCSAENTFYGEIIQINTGQVNTEFIIRISAKTVLCAITSSSSDNLSTFKQGDQVWAIFNSFAVVLHLA